MFGLTKREQQLAAWEREAAIVVPALAAIAMQALKSSEPQREIDCRTCRNQKLLGGPYCLAETCKEGDHYDSLPVIKLWKIHEA